MTIETLDDLICEELDCGYGFSHVTKEQLRELAIKHMKECLRKRKNPLNAWMKSLDIKPEDLKEPKPEEYMF